MHGTGLRAQGSYFNGQFLMPKAFLRLIETAVYEETRTKQRLHIAFYIFLWLMQSRSIDRNRSLTSAGISSFPASLHNWMLILKESIQSWHSGQSCRCRSIFREICSSSSPSKYSDILLKYFAQSSLIGPSYHYNALISFPLETGVHGAVLSWPIV